MLLLVLMVALLVAAHTAWQRYLLEKAHRSVELALLYDEVKALAELRGMSVEEVLAEFHGRGAGAVLIKEPTVAEAGAAGEFLVMTGSELSFFLSRLENGSALLTGSFRSIDPAHTYLIASSRESRDRLAAELRGRGVPVETWEDADLYVVEAKRSYDNIKNLGAGISPEVVSRVTGSGMRVLVQLHTWPEADPGEIKAVMSSLRSISGLSGILFHESTIPGYPDREALRTLAEEMGRLGVPVVQVEFFNQDGLNELGLLSDKRVVRLHTISAEEISKRKLSPGAVRDRYLLAATDRNVRILLVRLFFNQASRDLMEDSLNLVEGIAADLRSEGLVPGPAATFKPLPVSRWVIFVTGLGVIAGALLLAGRFLPYRLVVSMGLAVVLLWAVLLLVDLSVARKGMALTAALVFPVLAVTVGVRKTGVTPAWAVVTLLSTSLISLAGALLMVALLADLSFMLKLDQFAGVKVAHLFPLLVLVGIFFFTSEPQERVYIRLKNLFQQPLRVGLAGVAVFVVLVGVIYILRTGNEGEVAVSSLELQLRNWLDNLLVVRPRTKEFLLGHPALLLLLYTGYRDNRYLPLLFFGAIGQISIVNTFAHVHTPLLVSLLRVGNGLWLGVLVGLILIFLWRAVSRVAGRWFLPDGVEPYHDRS